MRMNIVTYDKQRYAITERQITDEGFLRVPGHVARIGIQEYLGSELGFNHNNIVRVYRPPYEVFSPESLASFDGSDVTIEHPDELVNSENYKYTSVGTVKAGASQDGDFVRCDLIVKDQQAIDSVMAGKVELSVGYTAIYKDEAGITPEGEPYDLMQTCIRVNHVALVDNARAGPQAKIFDSSKTTGGNKMPVHIVLDSGRSVDVADAANATVIADAFDRLVKRTKDAEEEKEKMEAAKDAAEEELEEEKKKSSDSAISDRVKAIADTSKAAKRIAGKDFVCDSVNVSEIQRSALKTAYPKRDWADRSAVYLQAAFDVAYEGKETEEEEEEEEKSKANDSYRGLSHDAALGTVNKDAAPVISRAQAALNKRTGKGVK
ncbi:gp27 putative head protein [Iodobacter phage PhiPLPE]|uniref:Gp27 putative head protein n=1 Tax=Iodobacter phage PhiPLPE TaxID=551895 RepID=B5AX46_9CAUD|nr:head maturation protease [Iodobacter phage PhiPLPE]ACG60349.1 gp27 putative head protein [Iodobacter phage PhiPLPE]